MGVAEKQAVARKQNRQSRIKTCSVRITRRKEEKKLRNGKTADEG